MEGYRSHKIAGVEERVGVEEIEAVVTDHSSRHLAVTKGEGITVRRRKQHLISFNQYRGNLSVIKGCHLRTFSDLVKVLFQTGCVYM